MLKTNKTRQTTAEFFTLEGEVEKLVKTTIINTDNNAVSTIYETLHDAEVVAQENISKYSLVSVGRLQGV